LKKEYLSCLNSNVGGQTCFSIKYVFVEGRGYSQFWQAAVAESQKIRLGDPLDGVDMRPHAMPLILPRADCFHDYPFCCYYSLKESLMIWMDKKMMAESAKLPPPE
jgi:hypothetical protein